MSLMQSTTTATEFHSLIQNQFTEKYEVSRDFRDRFEIWTQLIQQYGLAGSRVLDAGCGPGHLSFHCASLNCDVVAIDGSEKMIEHCRSVKESKGIANLKLIGDHFPIEDRHPIGEFDAIISSSVIEYIDPPSAYIEDLDSKLKKDGILLISVPNSASFYKKLESIFFRWTGHPQYRRYSKHAFSETELERTMAKLNYRLLDVRYYGMGKRPIGSMLSVFGQRRSRNIFVAVFRK